MIALLLAEASLRLPVILLAMAAPVLLGGCIARTALDVATAPVKVASKAADWATTSQDEADRNRGREIRRREERLARLDHDYQREAAKCREGSDRACRRAVELRAEIDALVPTIPVEPKD